VTTVVPSTLGASLAPTTPLATTLPVVTTSTLALGLTTSTTQLGDEARKLLKEIEYMSIQTKEINKLKEQITNLGDAKKLAQIMQIMK